MYPIRIATIAAIVLPRITATIVCHTDNDDATSEPPSCQLVKLSCQTDHQPMNVMVVQVRRLGGRGRISSLIHTDTAV